MNMNSHQMGVTFYPRVKQIEYELSDEELSMKKSAINQVTEDYQEYIQLIELVREHRNSINEMIDFGLYKAAMILEKHVNDIIRQNNLYI